MATSGVLSIRLPDELKDRLDALSAATGRPASFYVREALAEHLAELEYAYQLQAEAEAIRRGQVKTISWNEMLTDVGITEQELDNVPDEAEQPNV